jgi:hypothetical protein
MIKNVIIGVLAFLSLFFFFYGLTQQIKAEQLTELLLKSERKALQQRETLEAAVEQARRQAELTRLELERTSQARK